MRIRNYCTMLTNAVHTKSAKHLRGYRKMSLDTLVGRAYFHHHSTGERITDLPDPEPCPWCGSDGELGGVIAVHSFDGVEFQVICDRCGALGPPGQTCKDAAWCWNNRLETMASRRRPSAARLSVVALAVISLLGGLAHETVYSVAGKRPVAPAKVVPTGMHADKIREGLMIERRGGEKKTEIRAV